MGLLLERGTSKRHRPTRTGADQLGVALIKSLLADVEPREFAVRFWDGTTWEAEPGRPARFTLVINHPAALHPMLVAPTDLALGEAYIFQDIDIEGDLESALDLADELCRRRGRIGLVDGVRLRLKLQRLSRGAGRRRGRLEGDGRGSAARRAGWARRLAVRRSLERDRAAIAYHYDLSNDFYQLWLDRRMVYTCAYFATPDDDLDTAQERKLDHICRKLRLRPGERLLDLGCGWGALVIHAAERYRVDALGITLSREQAEFANERISRSGLADRCRVEHCDYRLFDDPAGYDKIACVGMFEHVGEANLPACLRQIWGLLRPGGVFLLHGITREYHSPVPESSFVNRYVFPNGELVPLSTTLRIAEDVGFEIRDVESLREHYTLTLRHWVSRLEAHRAAALRLIDETTFRIWKLYMAGSAHRFKVNKLNLHQTLLAKPEPTGASRLPLTRADWYATPPPRPGIA